MINGLPKFSLPTFNLATLQSFYSSGGGLSLAAQKARVSNLGIPNSFGDATILPPWERTAPAAANQTDLLNTIFSGKSLIDPDDPLAGANGDNETYQNMFVAYRALARLRELVTFAEGGGKAESLRGALQRQFTQQLSEIRDYVDSARFEGVTVLSGIRQSSVTAGVTIPTPVLSTVPQHKGAVVSEVREDPIAGLTGTETFTVTATTSSGSTDVTIDLSQVSGDLNVDNITAYINGELEANSVLTRFAVERFNEFAYGFRLDIATGETVTFTADPATESPAVYVAGTSGGGSFANGFLRKLDELASGEPNEAFAAGIATEAADGAAGTAVDGTGNVYVVGTTEGDMDGQLNGGTADAYLRKYDASGQLVWSRLLGSASSAAGFAVAVDSQDNVVVAGQTRDRLTGTAYGGNIDSFVTKFDADGREVFTRQAAPFADDAGLALTVDADDNIFLAGYANSAVSGDVASLGGSDGFLTKLASDGSKVYDRQFGSAGSDRATALAVDNAGNVFVAAEQNGRAVLLKFADDELSTTPTYEVDLGALQDGDAVTGLALGADGAVYVSGSVGGATLNGTVAQAYNGGRDGFVSRVVDSGSSGSVDYVSYVGSSGNDEVRGVAVRAVSGADEIYLTGTTDGSIAGAAQSGEQDGFVAGLNAAGATQFATQFGGAFNTRANAIVFDENGTSVVSRLGLPTAPVPKTDIAEAINLSSARAGQSFTISVNGEPTRQITLDEGDSFGFLAFKVNKVLGSSGRAEVASDIGGKVFKITAKNGGSIVIGAGPEGSNLLGPLGLKPATLYADPDDDKEIDIVAKVLGTDEEEEEKEEDGIFDLGFFDGLSVASKQKAVDAGIIIDGAMRALEKAFEFLNPTPKIENALSGVAISEADRTRIAGLQRALDQLNVLSQSQSAGSSFSLFT